VTDPVTDTVSEDQNTLPLFTTLPAPSLGPLTLVSTGTTTINITHPAAQNGTPPFTFQWYRHAGFGSFTPSPSTALTGQTGITLADTGLTAGTAYSYICVATDSESFPAASPQLLVSTNTALAIATPSAIAVGSTVSSIISSAATGGAPGYTYQWYRDPTGSGFTPGPTNILVGQTALTLNDSALTPVTNYWYKIVATDTSAATVTSTALEITTVTALTIANPTLTSVNSTTVVAASTGGAGGVPAITYQWYQSTVSGFAPGPATILVGQNAARITSTGLTPITTYYFIIEALDSVGDSTFSSQLSATTSAAVLSLGAITVNSVGQTAITLSAPNASGGAPAYAYAWSRSLVQGQIGTSLGYATQTITDTNLTPDTTYYYTCTVTDSESPTPATANSPQQGVITSELSSLGAYYANLLILQYIGMPKAFATVQFAANAFSLPATSTQTADNILALAVQNAFNLNTATGAQLDILGKYAAVTRSTHNLSGSPITLSDADFLSLIKVAVAFSSAGSDLQTIVNLLFQFFPGEIYVTDNQNMSLSYLINSSVGSQNLLYALINEDLLPRPNGVLISSVISNPSLNFFAFSSYGPNGTWIPAAPGTQGFQTYSSYNMNSPWMSYNMAVETGI
jgi:hypothetical protein